MTTSDPTVDALANWAEDREDVRALILTSTRAIAGAKLDAYSDYDVIVVTRDVEAMLEDTDWQGGFGEVLIAYWDPLDTDPATGAARVSSITNYTSGLKIDFNLWSPQCYADITAGPNPHPEFDAGYRVIIDKDGLTGNLPADTWSELEETFSDATPEANWEALFNMITLFSRVAREVAELLGYTYPERLITRVTDHARRMRDGAFAAGP